MNATACANCNSTLRQGKSFALKTSGGEITKCLFCALRHWPMLRRSLIVAAIMGTIISLLNQGNLILVGSWPVDLFWKVPLTYCAPFLVTTVGALSNGRR